ncbi:potassium channel family protein [Bacillus taeanensis]|nr:potassium channel family protein [Bacillus taeanensis]
MVLLAWTVMLLCILAVSDSFFSLFKQTNMRRGVFSFYKLALLFLIYLTIITAFACLYTIFMMNGLVVLKEGTKIVDGQFLSSLATSVYFSAVTLLSVGYGDITPIGIGRWIAVIEALLGYLLPAVFFVTTIVDYDREMGMKKSNRRPLGK